MKFIEVYHFFVKNTVYWRWLRALKRNVNGFLKRAPKIKYWLWKKNYHMVTSVMMKVFPYSICLKQWGSLYNCLVDFIIEEDLTKVSHSQYNCCYPSHLHLFLDFSWYNWTAKMFVRIPFRKLFGVSMFLLILGEKLHWWLVHWGANCKKNIF